MAKVFSKDKVELPKTIKKTSQGKGKLKTSSMNKHKRRNKGLNLKRG